MTGRLLVSCFPGHGHLNPLLPLVAAYRDAGWEVLVSTGPDLVDAAGRHGLAAVGTGLSHADTERAFLDRHPAVRELAPGDRIRAVLPGMFVDVAARSRAAELCELVSAWRPDLVLHDVTEFAAPLAALRAGVPRLAHGVTVLAPTTEWFAALEPPIDRLYAEYGVDGGTARLRDTTYLDICPPSLRPRAVNPFAAVRSVRPAAVASDPLSGALNDLPYERTVHVTLGTVVNHEPGLLETLVEGVRQETVNVVVTVGPDRDPAALGPQPAHVLVERYLSHAHLLPRCAAVVSHAGAGTLLGTLAAGAPSVLVPVGAEQVLNADLAAAAGVAVVVPPATATPGTVRAAVRAVLEDPAFGARARDVRSEIEAMPAGADVVRALRHPTPTA